MKSKKEPEKEWTLIKPRNDFFELRRSLEKLYFTLRTYTMFGTRSPFGGDGDYNWEFINLEKVAAGEMEYVCWQPEDLPYNKGQNVYNVEDAKQLWTLQVISTICSMLAQISMIKEFESEFSTYPLWLRSRCEFACYRFMPLFNEYLRKDPDCGYLADRTFLPVENLIPSRLPDKKQPQ